MNRTKLRNILKAISPETTAVDFVPFDNEVTKLKEKLKEQVVVKTLEDVNTALERNRKRINFEPLTNAFDALKEDIATKNFALLDTLNAAHEELGSLIKENDTKNNERINELTAEIAILSARKIEIPDFAKQITDTEQKLLAVMETAKAADEQEDKSENEAIQQQFAAFEQSLKKLRIETLSRGGGAMNRQIFISGVNPLTKYTDINLKPGAGTTITYATNDTTKKVDITITGGGSGSGITRSIATTTVSSTVGAVASTDYVVLANGGVQITLPDATNNLNMYTIKNIGTSSVLVGTTSAQTIDGSATLIMPVQYTSVDVVSNAANWEIT